MDNLNVLNTNLTLCWTGDYESLKHFVEVNFEIDGVWKSPGDERKPYSNGETTLMWWINKKKLQFTGKESSRIKQKGCSILMGSQLWHENNTSIIRDEDGNLILNNDGGGKSRVAALIEGPKLATAERRSKPEFGSKALASENLQNRNQCLCDL